MGDIPVINCGDCNLSDPEWASLNRGLLLCKDCAYIHRSLGPEFSRVKPWKSSSTWNPALRKMVLVLASGPANNVWEHTLLDPSTKIDYQTKKPGPNDSLEVKRKFIILKHLQFTFVLKQRPETFEERNRELHSTVRTSDIGTTLRLIASGADPNYFHPEKGTRPMHVAAKMGQASQIELLFQHGARSDAADYLGQSPVEHAMAASLKELATRILELRYQLTDKMAHFACGETPDHSISKHIVIPKIRSTDPLKESAIKKFQPNAIEQLAVDIYDEIERREIEATLTSDSDRSKYSIAFLPVNPVYPSVRNQTRQKFARLSNQELSGLISLVLCECQRRHRNGTGVEDTDIFTQQPSGEVQKEDPQRHHLHKTDPPPEVSTSTPKILTDDDFPLYDSVADDEDLVVAQEQTASTQKQPAIEETAQVSSSNPNPISKADEEESKEIMSALEVKLAETELKIGQLEESNQSLKLEVKILEKMVDSLIHENIKLRVNSNLLSQSSPGEDRSPGGGKLPYLNGNNGSSSNSSRDVSPCTSASLSLYSGGSKLTSIRAASLFEPRSKRQEEELPIRPNTTELYLRMDPRISRSELIQDTVKKIVEMIKVLVEFANSVDFGGMLLTANKIYDVADEMASTLLLLEPGKELVDKARDLLYQVMHMQSEIRVLAEGAERQMMRMDDDETERVIRKVKFICYEVGATMKKLVTFAAATG